MEGDDFRDLVVDLMASAGFRIETEREITGKRVDIVAEAELLGRPRRYAVECKCYERRVGISDITLEVSEYGQILHDQGNGIDEVWMISLSGFTDAAIKHARSHKHIDLISFNELLSRLLDIRPYLQMLVDNYNSKQKNDIYIPLRTLTPSSLDEEVDAWISQRRKNALAVVAGYGRGKTTFAQRLAAKLAQEALNDPSKRAPIIIPLSEISHQVKISGLIADTISNQTLVSRFSYNSFKKLNQAGRFVLILDGFDEMKFGLNFEEFSKIFSQIYDLIVGKAKILILGRPSAFLSESEELAVLSGSQADQYSERKDVQFQGFSLLSIDLFTIDEAKFFIKSYAKQVYLLRNQEVENLSDLDARSDRWLDLVDSEIIRRPVHARMLGEIIASGKLKPIPINHYSLYKYFVDSSIERELQKEGRDPRISIAARREFIGQLAWWSWTDLKRTSFAATDISEKIYDVALENVQIPRDVGKREIIISSIVERKNISDPKLSFQHRSMQEFLVADMVLRWKIPSHIVLTLSRGLTPELAAFFIDQRHKDTLQVAFDQFVGGSHDKFHIQYLRLFLLADKAGLIKRPPIGKNDEPFSILYHLFQRINAISWKNWANDVVKFALSQVQLSKPRQSILILQMITAYLVNQDRESGRFLAELVLRAYSKLTKFELISKEMRKPGVSWRNANDISVPVRSLFMHARYIVGKESRGAKIRFNFLSTLQSMRRFSKSGSHDTRVAYIEGIPLPDTAVAYSVSVDRFMEIFDVERDRADIITEFEHMAFKNKW